MAGVPRRERLKEYYREVFEALRRRYRGFDPLTAEAFISLLRTGDQLRGLIERRCRRRGLTGPAFGILNLLDTHQGGRLPMRDLSERLLVSQANLTGLVDTLERSGFVRRLPDSADRRVTYIEITAAGRAKLESFRPDHFRFIGELLANYSNSEKRSLIGLLARLRGDVARLSRAEEPERPRSAAKAGKALGAMAGAFLFCVGAASAQGLTLKEAVGRALDSSPEVRRAAEEARIAALEEPSILAETDPTVGLRAEIQEDRAPRAAPTIQGAYSKAQSYDLTLDQYWLTGGRAQVFFKSLKTDNPAFFRPLNPTADSRLGLELRQPLLRYFWGRPDKAKRGQARSGAAAAQHRLERTREQVAARAAFAYLEAFVAAQELDIREAGLKDARKLLEKTREKARYGLSEDSDLLQAEASVRVQEAELRTARAALAQSRNALSAAMNGSQSALETLALPPPPRRTLPAVEEALAEALEGRADLRAAADEARRAEWFLRVERLSTLPDLSAFGSFASAGLSGSLSDSWSDASKFVHRVAAGGLELKIPLGFKRESLRREQALRRLEAARAERELLETAVRREVADAIESLAAALERSAAYGALLDLETRKLAAEEANFKRGRSTTDMLIRFQGDIRRAQSQLVRAQSDVLGGWAALGFSTGRILASLAELEEARP